MTDTPEFVVTEGRAYHRGDVILLRSKRDLSQATRTAYTERLGSMSGPRSTNS
jgi:hypothetical protein